MPETFTTDWDPADHLQTGEDMAAYLEAALDEDDPALVVAVLDDIARANEMMQVMRDAELGRKALTGCCRPPAICTFRTV